MARGSKKAQVHSVFKERLQDKRKQADEIAEAIKGGPRPWQLPEPLKDKDLLDVPGLHDPAFERKEINANYDEVLASPASAGTNGDAMSLKLQVDTLHVHERAFRLRHATPIRCIIVAHGRRKGHGHGEGVFEMMRRQAENLIQAGAG